MDIFDLTGRTALVTGSSRGIGRTLAEGLAAAGARSCSTAPAPSDWTRPSPSAGRRDSTPTARAFDVTDTDAVDAAIEGIESDVGPIDILINNAGIQRRVPILECDDATFDEVMSTNLASMFKVSRAVGRCMVPRGRGKIVNIGSIQSSLGRPSIAPLRRVQGRGRDADEEPVRRVGAVGGSRSTGCARATSAPS